MADEPLTRDTRVKIDADAEDALRALLKPVKGEDREAEADQETEPETSGR